MEDRETVELNEISIELKVEGISSPETVLQAYPNWSQIVSLKLPGNNINDMVPFCQLSNLKLLDLRFFVSL